MGYSVKSVREWWRWVVSSAVGVALVTLLMLPGGALALSLEDVKRMAAAGLDDNTIISIIEKSMESFVLDQAVEADLVAAGVSQRVLNALRATGPQPQPEVRPDPVGSPDLSPAVGPEPLLAPAGVGNLGRILNAAARTAKQQFDVSAAATLRLREQQQRDHDSAKLQRAYQDVVKATREVETNALASLVACHQFLTEFNPAPHTDEYYTALWCKAAAFHRLGVHQRAAPLLRDVVMYGAERERFDSAFGMLVTSADLASFYPPDLVQMDKLYIEDRPKSLQNRYNYFLGRYYGDVAGDQERALTLLARVGKGEKVYAQARYAMGVIQTHPNVRLYRSAVESFQEAIIAAESLGADGQELIELGYLALARIAYEATNYEGALYYYNKVPRTSVRYPQALFEMAWTYFMQGDQRNALGTFHSLGSPYYAGYYFPDLWVLEATTYLNLCRYGEARLALDTFKEIYLSQLPRLSEFLSAGGDPAQVYTRVVASIAQRESGKGELPAIFVEAVLSDVTFYNLYKMVRQIELEVELVRPMVAQLGALGTETMTQMERVSENKRFEAGLRTQAVLKRIENELREWDVTSTEAFIEIMSAEKELDEVCLRLAAQGRPCDFTTEEATVVFLVADDWQFWPFEGEYWVDEVGSYKSYLGDRCRVVESQD